MKANKSAGLQLFELIAGKALDSRTTVLGAHSLIELASSNRQAACIHERLEEVRSPGDKR